MNFLEQTLFLGNSLWAWGVALTHVVVALALRTAIMAAVVKLLSMFISAHVRRMATLLMRPVMGMLVIVSLRIGFLQLAFDDETTLMVQRIFTASLSLMVTWLVAMVVQCLVEFYLMNHRASRTKNELHVISVLNKFGKTIVWILGIITAINNSGYDVWTLIAGLGIGGLTMALAAQNTASNIFGGVTIFIDKPFSLGERIRIGGYDGYVEMIGLRNVRLRTLAGTLLSIPNSKITDSLVENVSLEPSRKVTVKLGLTYSTTHTQMQAALAELGELVERNQEKLEEAHYEYFDSFGDSSLSITFIYYIRKSYDIFRAQSEVNLEILRRFGEKDLQFAFPSQTIYFDENQMSHLSNEQKHNTK